MVDVSVVMTFHDEGPLAQQSLNALRRCTEASTRAGLRVEVVAVLDRPSPETARIVMGQPGIRVVPVDVGDLGISRNLGIAASAGQCVSVIDGDDYWSADWLTACHPLAQADVVLRHEWVLMFGERNEFMQQVPQTDELFDADSLLVFNPYVSSCFARREVFERHPYREKRQAATGYGYEDWHWLCETVSAGVTNRVVPGTALFYRQKPSGMLAREREGRAILPPTSLFAPGGRTGAPA